MTILDLSPSTSVRSTYRTQLSMASTATPSSSKKGEVVEIVLNNDHANPHAWYLHHHLFQVIQRSDLETGPFTGLKKLAPIQVRRDKIGANIHVHLVLRFTANNPGVARGDANLQVPYDHLKSCHDYGMKTGGNAAGHLKDPLNLNGSVTKPSTNVPRSVIADEHCSALSRPTVRHKTRMPVMFEATTYVDN
ncbi:hypothetical protein MMC22_006751 [Lobaria immixta]|nr:hypothetical protein [Lobaria immixta]